MISKTYNSIGIALIALVLLIGGYYLFGKYTVTTEVANTNTTTDTAHTAEFDKTVTMNIGDEVSFEDGLHVNLISISDSRCKPGVECFWQGELSGLFILNNSAGSDTSPEFHLGAVTTKTVTVADHTFTLVVATEKSMDIVVSKLKI